LKEKLSWKKQCSPFVRKHNFKWTNQQSNKMYIRNTYCENQIEHITELGPVTSKNENGSKVCLRQEYFSTYGSKGSVLLDFTPLKWVATVIGLTIFVSALLVGQPFKQIQMVKSEPIRIVINESDSFWWRSEAAKIPPAASPYLSIDQVLNKLADQNNPTPPDQGSLELKNILLSDINQNLVELAGKEKDVSEDSNQDNETAPPFYNIILQAAFQHSIDPALIRAVIMAESSYNPDAVSKSGAKGLMQLMPRTAQALGVKDILDPIHNINGGTKYLRQMLDRFEGDVKLALAAYNAGSRHVKRYGGIPPFKETRNYVKKVLNYYETYQKEFLANEYMTMATL
jgi:soluble lytic murein transglycosylase-like protein